MTIRDRYIRDWVKTRDGEPSDFHKEMIKWIEEEIDRAEKNEVKRIGRLMKKADEVVITDRKDKRILR